MAKVNKVWIVIGQSNGLGKVEMSEMTQLRVGLKYNLRVFNGTGFECINNLVNNNQYGDPRNLFGYEMELQDLPNDLDEDIYLLKFCLGSTILAYEPSFWNQSWNILSGQLYNQIKTHITTVANWMNTRKKAFEIEGVIWHQGEGDSLELVRANAYQVNENNLINGINTHIGYTPKWYIVGMNPTYINSYAPALYANTVEAAKVANVAADTSYRRYVSQAGVPLGSDLVHLNATGVTSLGQRIIEAIKLDL